MRYNGISKLHYARFTNHMTALNISNRLTVQSSKIGNNSGIDSCESFEIIASPEKPFYYRNFCDYRFCICFLYGGPLYVQTDSNAHLLPAGAYIMPPLIEGLYFKICGNAQIQMILVEPGYWYSELTFNPTELINDRLIYLVDSGLKLWFEYEHLLEISNIKRKHNVLLKMIHKLTSNSNTIKWGAPGLQLLKQNHGRLDINTLATETCHTLRTLERKYKNCLGITPKQLSQMVRIHSIISKHLQTKHINWADLAHLYGFSDQPHFIREFKKRTGVSPDNFKNELFLLNTPH